MKKLLLISFAILFLFGCKKENIQNHSPSSVNDNVRTLSGIEMNSFGYLIFTDSTDLNDYCQDLTTQTYSDVESAYNTLGFVPSHVFDSDMDDSTVRAEDIPNLILNSHSVVKVGGLILRPLNDSIQLVMSSSLIDSTAYSYLSAGTFNSDYMCRLSTTSSDYDDFEALELLIGENPTGIDDTPQMPPARKFIGTELSSSTATPGPNGPLVYNCCYKTYFFWFQIGIDCYPSTSPCPEKPNWP